MDTGGIVDSNSNEAFEFESTIPLSSLYKRATAIGSKDSTNEGNHS